MFKAVRQMRVRRSLTALIKASCFSALLAGCPGGDVIGEEGKCLEERRCTLDRQEVCGEDGKQYACASMARCEGVIVDPSGDACRLPPEPPVCDAITCDLFCEEGHAKDANGCSVCECAPPRECVMPGCIPGTVQECGPDRDGDGCPDCTCVEEPVECLPVACNLFCAKGYKVDEQGCDLCECVEEPVCTFQPCPEGTTSECSPDVDGDGCPQCFCIEEGCPPNRDAVECRDGNDWVCVDQPDGTKRWECQGTVECPPSLPPRCFANEREESGDLDGDGCSEGWCEPQACPPIAFPGCGGGPIVHGRDEAGCTVLSCLPVMCPDVGCFDIFCPYGYEVDEFGCQTCECRLPDCDEGAACDVLCGDGSEMNQWACDFCGCDTPDTFCLRDEDCEMAQECVLDQLDPSLCCDLDAGQACPDDVPPCTGTCETRVSCEMLGAPCADGSTCEELERDDCCPRALQCEAFLPLCPTLCL